MRILGIDPGGTVGLAWFDNPEDHYFCQGYDQVGMDDFPLWLEKHRPIPDLIVLENYRLWKHRAIQQSGSSLPAAQTIGMAKSYAKIRDIKIIEQSPQILQNAEKMSGLSMSGKSHSKTHWVAAYNHVWWYLVKNELAKVEIAEADRL